MAVGDMTYVMPECDRFYEILVQSQAPPYRPRNLRYELDMDNPVGDVIVFHQVKDLGLVNVPRICPGMDDAIGIAGVRGADIFSSPVVTARCICAGGSKRREKGLVFSSNRTDSGIKILV